MEGANPYPRFEDGATKAHRGEEMGQRPRDSEVEPGFDLQQAVSPARWRGSPVHPRGNQS